MKLDIQLESKEIVIRDLRANTIRQGENRRAFRRAKVYMLISLAVLCYVWDKVLIVDRLSSVYIKADPISEENGKNSRITPVLKKEASNVGLMHSKRFFSPEIKIEHSIAVTEDDSKDNSYMRTLKNPIYTYTRDHRLDRVHLILPYKGKLLRYKRAYFSTLLELFPSMHGYVSIWTDRRDSFFSFINSPDVEKHKYKLLALLLRLAEGVDVPLIINKSQNRTELVLKKADGRKEHFRLNMNVLVKAGKNAESLDVFERVFQKQAVDVVRFFIQNRKNKVFIQKQGSSELPFCKEFGKVQFVNSPRFLIQTYIRHCLESTEEMASLIQSVRDLLSEYMWQEKASPKKKQRKQTLVMKAKKMFSKYFISGMQRSNNSQHMDATHPKKTLLFNHYTDCLMNTLYLEPVAGVAPVKKKMKTLRLLSSVALGVDLPDGKIIYADDSAIPLPEFIDFGETVLLGLFCWAAYNPKKHIYTVEHIESASKELKSFFQKHKYMYGGMSKSMHDEWNKVVGDLSDPNIQYMRPDRNQLVSGIINMLYVIKEITGVGDTVQIDGFRERLKRMEEEQQIEEVKLIYMKLTQYANNTEEEKDEMKLQILGMIDVKRLCEIRILEEALKKEKNREGADVIKLKMQELMDISALYKSYIKQEEAQKTELKKNIEKYLTEVINQISIAKDVTISIDYMFKKNVKESCSDAFGSFQLVHHKKSYYYSFYTYFKYSPEVVELKYDSFFAMYKRLYTPENKQLGVFARKEIFQVIAELKRKNLSNLNEEFQPTLFYDDECKNVDVHLLDPLMHIPEYKVYIIWALLLHAKERNLDSDHPLVRLADNLLESTCFMDRNNKNEMFMVLRLISDNKYYPHITIDKHAYENEECFANIIENLLELANKTTLVSHKTYADIITDLMIRLHREFPKDNNRSGLKYFAEKLSDIPEARALFFKILTLDGTTMEYITRIVQCTQGIEKTPLSDGCRGYNNVFLLWFILDAINSRRNEWQGIIKGCYDLIDVTELKKRKSIDFSSLWGDNVYIISLLKGIKYIVCIEYDAKSMERFESIKELFSKFRRW